jgi:hypothetical protein
MRRRPILWFSSAAAVVVLAGVAAAALVPRDPRCARHEEAVRPLDLADVEDRTHLDHDMQDVHAAAERFSAAVARRPRTADSIDAIEGYREAPARSRIWCEAILEADVARTHGISEADLKGIERHSP